MGSFRSYFFTDGPAMSWTRVSQLIAAGLEKRALKVPIPMFAARIAGGLSALYTGLTRRALLLSRDKIRALEHERWVVSDARARAELGYVPHCNSEQGLWETARWYREEGWL
jgi:nucleoside-diphosphate-sugar epimerase